MRESLGGLKIAKARPLGGGARNLAIMAGGGAPCPERKLKSTPTCLSAGSHPPAARSATGRGCEKPFNPREAIMAKSHRKPASGQDAFSRIDEAGHPAVAPVSRRLALRSILGSACVVALPAGAALSFDPKGKGDPDKRLRWLGEQLEPEFEAYRNAAGRVFDLKLAAHAEFGSHMRFVNFHRDSGAFQALEYLHGERERLWGVVSVRADDIYREPVQSLAGLVVKARAIEILAFGVATVRCALEGTTLTDAEIGWWPAWRMRRLVNDVAAVAGVAS